MKAERVAVYVVVMSILLSLVFNGCGGGGDQTVTSSDNSTNKADSSTLVRNLEPQAEASVLQDIVYASNEMGIKLLKDVSTGNAVVAPFRASLSLARLRAGAAGETKDGISQVMNLDASAELDAAFNSLDLDVESRIVAATLAGQTSLSSSQGWVQKRYGFLLTYLDNLAENYGLQMAGVDYALAQTDAWATIDSWASYASGGFHGTLTLGQDTRLVLGDALRLNAAWENPFDPAQTQTDWFELLDGTFIEVPFMRQEASIATMSGDGYAVYELPAGRSGLTFLIIAPEKGRFSEIATSLTAAKLNQITAALVPASVNLMLPKFSIYGSTVDLSAGNATQKDVADFSAMDGTKDLYMTSRAHNARFSISESGLQGGSVTLLGLDDAHPDTWTNPDDDEYGGIGYIIVIGVSPSLPEPVAVGRPFIFAVRDSVSGTVLFMGRVINPAQ